MVGFCLGRKFFVVFGNRFFLGGFVFEKGFVLKFRSFSLRLGVWVVWGFFFIL